MSENEPSQLFERAQVPPDCYVERRPIPDPTNLTVIALDRAVHNLRELLSAEIKSAESSLTAKVEGHWALDLERFKAVDLRFSERDLRFSQAATDNSEAIRAALTAANNATVRLEMTFSKQIDAIGDRLDKQVTGIIERVTDLKDRIANVEGSRKGSDSVIGWVIGSAGVVVATIAVIFSITHFVPPVAH